MLGVFTPFTCTRSIPSPKTLNVFNSQFKFKIGEKILSGSAHVVFRRTYGPASIHPWSGHWRVSATGIHFQYLPLEWTLESVSNRYSLPVFTLGVDIGECQLQVFTSVFTLGECQLQVLTVSIYPWRVSELQVLTFSSCPGSELWRVFGIL